MFPSTLPASNPTWNLLAEDCGQSAMEVEVRAWSIQTKFRALVALEKRMSLVQTKCSSGQDDAML